MQSYFHETVPNKTVERVHEWLSQEYPPVERGVDPQPTTTITYGEGAIVVRTADQSRSNKVFRMDIFDKTLCAKVEEAFPWIEE